MNAAVEVEGVTKRFGGTLALDDVSFSVRQGEVLALLGPNGAWKTTLVRVLTTLLRADSGRARVAGLDVAKDARAIRSVIGLAGQYATVDDLGGRQPGSARGCPGLLGASPEDLWGGTGFSDTARIGRLPSHPPGIRRSRNVRPDLCPRLPGRSPLPGGAWRAWNEPRRPGAGAWSRCAPP
jgi:hypothetical protein